MKLLNRCTVLCARITDEASGRGVQAMIRTSVLLAIAFAMFAMSPFCLAQAQTQTGDFQTGPGVKPASIDSAIEVARSNIRADKNAMISAGMNFSDKDGAAFWPVYRKYEYEQSAVEDLQAAVVKEYVEKYLNMTDADAQAMSERMFECDSREVELRRKYFKEFNKVLPAITVAKFFQLEHRIDLLIGMKVESSLPSLGEQQHID